MKTIDFTNSELSLLMDATAHRALETAGVTPGMVSGPEATRKYGRIFQAGVRDGQISPIFKSASAHAQKAYRVSDILAYIATSTRQARIVTEQSHTNPIKDEN